MLARCLSWRQHGALLAAAVLFGRLLGRPFRIGVLAIVSAVAAVGGSDGL